MKQKTAFTVEMMMIVAYVRQPPKPRIFGGRARNYGDMLLVSPRQHLVAQPPWGAVKEGGALHLTAQCQGIYMACVSSGVAVDSFSFGFKHLQG